MSDDVTARLARLEGSLGAVSELGETLGRHERMFDAFGRTVDVMQAQQKVLAKGQATLIAKVAAGRPAEPERPVPVDWLTVDDPAVARAFLKELAGWVGTVWCEFAVIHPCWPWHPWLVAELGACMRAHCASLTADAWPTAAMDWHARFAPAAESTCRKQQHHCGAKGDHLDDWRVDPGQRDAYATWWATRHANESEGPSDPPGLTRKETR